MNIAQQIQTLLASVGYYTGQIDGQIGPKTQAAIALAARLQCVSSFADLADIAAFQAAKARGLTDEEAFAFGDNGIGEWGDSTVQGTGPSVALPPECIIAKWGSLSAGHKELVRVCANGKSVLTILKDTMPHLANIHDGACIDCNPDTVAALGLTPPVLAPGSWAWV
ncbi:MAG TPA: peptidoglycan-binding protein [Terracidiphilus sp.]|nr:peptidoglycan-binding protein [Terracidiphilus sp.]